jgi:hypothetical protein
VIHTTEGDPGTINGCRDTAESHTEPPQLWYHPELRWLGQGLPLDRSSYALAHPSGTPETNKAGAIQVEVFGFAADTWSWTYQLDNLGTDVVAPILAAGWPIDLTELAATTGSDGAGDDGAVRFDQGTWQRWAGLCVHASVPNNDHWDAGDIDLDRIVAAATGTQPPKKKEDQDMPYLLLCPDRGDDGRWWVTNMRTDSRPVDTLADANNIDWFLRQMAGVDGLVCNRADDGSVAGPIAVDADWLNQVTAHAAATP